MSCRNVSDIHSNGMRIISLKKSKVFAISDLNASYLVKLSDLHNPILKHCIICVQLPCDAPFRFDALNGGVVYVLKSQAILDLCAIHAHADLNWPHTRQRRGRVTHDLRHSPSEDKANRYKPIRFWQETKHDTKFKQMARHIAQKHYIGMALVLGSLLFQLQSFLTALTESASCTKWALVILSAAY